MVSYSRCCEWISCWRARFPWKKVTKYKKRKCCQLLIEWQSLHTGVARQSHVYPRPLLTKGIGLPTENYSLRVSLDCARSIFPKISVFSVHQFKPFLSFILSYSFSLKYNSFTHKNASRRLWVAGPLEIHSQNQLKKIKLISKVNLLSNLTQQCLISSKRTGYQCQTLCAEISCC